MWSWRSIGAAMIGASSTSKIFETASFPHAFCLTTGHPDSVDASRILDRLSPQAHGALGATTRSRAAIVALRTRADGVEGPHSLRNTVDYFRTGVKDALTLLVKSKSHEK